MRTHRSTAPAAAHLALALTLLAGTAEAAPGDKVFSTIGPRETKELIETRGDLVRVDVRSPEEFRHGTLPGFRSIPFWEILKGNHDLPRDRPILLVCAVGGRSLAVGQLLSLKGYREVYNLEGGLEEWVRQRVPLPRIPTGAPLRGRP